MEENEISVEELLNEIKTKEKEIQDEEFVREEN